MMASDRLTDNNPNIANLGDKNRPTNLADKFSELYSNEWTNALESLENDYETESETANIKTLLEIVKVVHFFLFYFVVVILCILKKQIYLFNIRMTDRNGPFSSTFNVDYLLD